jgi:hypothetical protein
LATRRGGRERTESVGPIGFALPPGPMMVAVPTRQAYVARCTSSRLSGPAREDGVDVKQALDEEFEERH